MPVDKHIELVEVYRYGGINYRSYEQAYNAYCDDVGEFMQNVLLKDILLGPKDKLRLLQNILDNAKSLEDIL